MYGIHNNHDHIDEGWKNREVGERRKRVGKRWGKMRETGDKGERRGVGEDYPLFPPHRFRDSICLFGIANAHHTPVI